MKRAGTSAGAMFDMHLKHPNLVTLIIYNIWFQQLSARFSVALNADNKRCLEALIQLQSNACERLKEREHFQSTGVATIKVRLPGSTSTTPLQIRLSALVSELQQLVADKAGVTPDR